MEYRPENRNSVVNKSRILESLQAVNVVSAMTASMFIVLTLQQLEKNQFVIDSAWLKNDDVIEFDVFLFGCRSLFSILAKVCCKVNRMKFTLFLDLESILCNLAKESLHSGNWIQIDSIFQLLEIAVDISQSHAVHPKINVQEQTNGRFGKLIRSIKTTNVQCYLDSKILEILFVISRTNRWNQELEKLKIQMNRMKPR